MNFKESTRLKNFLIDHSTKPRLLVRMAKVIGESKARQRQDPKYHKLARYNHLKLVANYSPNTSRSFYFQKILPSLKD